MQASFADAAVCLVDFLLQLIDVAEGQVAAQMLSTTTDGHRRWRLDANSQCMFVGSVFVSCVYLGYGLNGAFLRTTRRYGGQAGLLTLIGRNKAEATEELVSVGAGGDAGGVWTYARTEQMSVDQVTFNAGMDVTVIKKKYVFIICGHTHFCMSYLLAFWK